MRPNIVMLGMHTNYGRKNFAAMDAFFQILVYETVSHTRISKFHYFQRSLWTRSRIGGVQKRGHWIRHVECHGRLCDWRRAYRGLCEIVGYTDFCITDRPVFAHSSLNFLISSLVEMRCFSTCRSIKKVEFKESTLNPVILEDRSGTTRKESMVGFRITEFFQMMKLGNLFSVFSQSVRKLSHMAGVSSRVSRVPNFFSN